MQSVRTARAGPQKPTLECCMSRKFSRSGLLAAALLLPCFTLALPAQQPAAPQGATIARDILTGRVTGPNGAIGGATVVVFIGGADTTRRQQARTDEEGRWLSAVQNGIGEYTVRAQAIGMKPLTQTAKRGMP